MPVRLGIVGSGQISHRYLKQTGPHAEIVATCARHAEKAEALAREYGVPAWYDDYERMYEEMQLDGVVVATPSNAHRDPTIAALERKIAVLCEKPMATTLEDCVAMVAAAQQSGAVFLALPFDASAGFREALKYVNEQTIGAFTGAEAQLMIAGHDRANWYYDREVAGGVMLDTLVYPVSSLISFLGPAAKVTAFANTLIPHRRVGDQVVDTDIDDNVTLIVEWPGGQQAVLRALWGISGLVKTTTIYGRHGTVWFPGWELIVKSEKRVIEGAEVFSNGIHGDCYRIPLPKPESEGLLAHFADCIRGQATPTCAGAQQLHVHEILFKAYEAARTGSTQQLETTFTPWHEIDPAFYDTRSRVI